MAPKPLNVRRAPAEPWHGSVTLVYVAAGRAVCRDAPMGEMKCRK